MKIILAVALAVLIMLSGIPAPVVASEYIVFNYIGQQIVPNKMRFNGTLIGGLSSLDYNPATGRYLAISDDRSKVRFYELSLDLALFQRSASPGMEGVKFHSVIPIQGPDGGSLEKKGLDPEALRFDRNRNRIYWSSEGRRGTFGFANPAVREMNPDGSYTRDFPVPSSYFPQGSNMGIFPG